MSEIPCENLTRPTVLTGGNTTQIRKFRWAGIKAGDTCAEFGEGGAYSKKTVHVFGTWAGATLPIMGRGSLDAPALVLMDVWGNLLNIAEDEISEIYGNMDYLAPGAIVGGDATTNLTVVLELED